MNNDKLKLIDFPKIIDVRGNLAFMQHPDQVPFEIQRAYWINDVPVGEVRGGHAFKEQYEIIIAISVNFNVVFNEGENQKVIT